MRCLIFCSRIALLLVLLSCSSEKVVTEGGMNTDFSKYKSFSFLNWQKDIDRILNEQDIKTLRDALINDFEGRNIRFVETGGDIAVSVYIVINKENSTISYTNYYSDYGGRYAGRFYSGWGGGYAATVYGKKDYRRGSLVVDMFEATGEQIWQGVVSEAINKEVVKREKTIPKKVHLLMEKVPIYLVK